jgi:hypothetical protein
MDESTITHNVNDEGIWQRKEAFLDEGFYETEAHPISVMVWRTIGPGFRSKLLCCHRSGNGTSDMETLANHHVFFHLIFSYGRAEGFIWQQDNAPAHDPGGAVIREHFPCLKWSSHSLD